ncbi:hypothetical protein [Paracoccus marcusii]|uniref:hypothetical protein n=1 Tax=Paracoccus marcusii TaxID=59779 RepID=UPI002ECFCC81
MVLNRTRPNTRLSVEVAQKAAELGAQVADTQVANRVVYAETLGLGLGRSNAPKVPQWPRWPR